MAIFPGEPGLAGFIGTKDNGSGGNNWSYNSGCGCGRWCLLMFLYIYIGICIGIKSLRPTNTGKRLYSIMIKVLQSVQDIVQSNQYYQQTNTQLFTDRMPFSLLNQQCRSTEGKVRVLPDTTILDVDESLVSSLKSVVNKIKTTFSKK